jgi:hypothetical protein
MHEKTQREPASLAQQNAAAAEIQRTNAAAGVLSANGGPPASDPPVKDAARR